MERRLRRSSTRSMRDNLIIIMWAASWLAGLLMQQVDAAGLENGSISGPIVDLQVRSFTESDCETVIFQLELPMYTAEDVSSNVSLRPSVEQAIEDLVVATLPNMELHLIATRISRNEDNNRGVAVFDTSIDFYDTAEGGRFAAYLTVDGGHEAVFLDHGLGTAHLRQQECRFTKNGEQAVQQHLDIVSFTGRPFEGHGHFETFESIEALYRIALVRLLESLDNSRQLPHIDLQSFPGPDELINIQARIAFREDQEGARKFESLIGLWGLAINGRAQALGPEDALRSESALSAAVKDVSRTIHISNRVRFTLTLRECEMPLVSAEGLHKLEMALKDFYADVLPQIIGMPSAVNILWSRVHEQITSTVTLGLSIQFLDNSGAAEKLTALLTAKSTYFNNMSPPQLGIADYTDVTGRHDTSTLRFTGHLPGQDLGGMGPEHLEHLRLEYATAIKSLSSALSLQDSDPSVRVLQIQDSCVRRKEVQCGMELMLDTIMTLADDVDGAQRFQEAISHPSPRGFDRSPLTRLLRNATFTNIAGCDNLRPPTNAQHADDITRGVWFSTILLDQNSPSSSLELKYGAWGQGFVDKYKEIVRVVAARVAEGRVLDVQVLQVDGGTNPVLQTYVSMRGYAAVHRLSSALTQFPGNIMEQNLELELGRVRLVDISGSQVARQVRFTALLADMKGEEEFDAFRAEYQHELLKAIENGVAQISPSIRVVHAEKREEGWMLDTSLVFLDDEQAPYDFISAASVQVPLALRAALGHVAVTHISGDVESHRITFKTRLQDFQGCVIQEEQLKQLGLFHELVFSNAASRLQIGSNVLLSIETVAVQNEGIPTVNTLVVVEGDQFASDSIVNLVGKHGGGLSLRSSLSGEERQIILPARRFMQEHGHLHATSSSAESSAFYGFRGPMPSTSDEASELSSLVKGSSSSSSEQFYGASYHSAKASKQVPLHNSTHNASDPAGYWAHNETTTAGVKEYATSNRVHSKAESRNVTVEFVAVFGDKRMSDLRENARMDEFMGGYLRSVTLALQKLKLAPKDSDSLYVTGTNGQRHLLQVGTEDGSTVPRISVTGVFGRYDGVGVDTQVAFHNGDPETAGKRLTAALTQSPDALAPAFSHLGRVRFIVKASDFGHPIQPVGMSSLAGLESNAKQIFPAISDIPATTPPADACRHKDKHGGCCDAPHALDAMFDCCHLAVDECGVCGGEGSSCAISAVVTLVVPFSGALVDKLSDDFAQVVADFKAGLGELLAPYGVDSAIGIQVDRSWMKFRDLGLAPYRGYVELDAPFTVYPHEGLVAVPDVKSLRTLLKTASDERATYKNLAMIALKDVYRQGVCGNGICELGEMHNPLTESTSPGACVVDCLSDVCPRSDMNSLVGQRLSECSGKGACNRLAAECECQEGYTGEACDSCADGYTMDARDCTQKNPTADYSVAATTSSAAKSLDVEDITASNKPAGWAVAVVCVLGSLIVISFAASVYIWATTRTQDRASPRQESRTSRWSDISKTIEVSIPDGCVDAMDVESRYGRHQGGSFHGWLGKEAEIMAAPTINSTARCMSSPERAAVMQLEGLLTGSRPSPKKSLPEEEAPPKAPEVHASRHSVPLSGVLQHSNERSTLDRLQDVSQHIDCSDAFPVMRHSEDAAALPVEMAEFGQAPDRQSDMPRPVWQRARSDTGKTRSEHTMKRSVPSPASLYAAEPMEMMEPELQAPAALRSGSPGAAKLMTGDSYPMAADLRGEPHGGCEGMLDAAALLSCRALATVSETDMGAGGTARAAPSRSHHADAQPGSSGELSVLLDPPETLDISVSMGVRGAPVRDVRMTRASAWGSNPEEPEPKASLEILCSAKMLSAMLSAEAAVPQQQPLRAEHRAFPRGDEEQSLEIEDRPSSPDSQTSYFSTESYSDVRCNPKELKKHSSSTGSLSARHGSPLNDEEAMSRAFLSAQTSGRRGSAPQQDVGLWIDG